jgi:hypothetical protein
MLVEGLGAQVTEGWRKLPKEKLYNFSSSNIIRLIQPGGVKWAGHLTSNGEEIY